MNGLDLYLISNFERIEKVLEVDLIGFSVVYETPDGQRQRESFDSLEIPYGVPNSRRQRSEDDSTNVGVLMASIGLLSGN